MRKHTAALIACVTLGSVLAGCAPQSRFAWGDYENSLYVYYKSPDKKAVYEKALIDAIADGRKKNKIAPGLLAELGYLYFENGDMGRALPLFQEEMTLFPESRIFLTGLINRTQGGNQQNQAGATPL